MTTLIPSRRAQQGSMLLEALISILIFSIGILAIVGLQANAIKMSGDAKYRSDASLLADQYIASMWASVATAVTSSVAGTPTPFDPNQYANFNTGGSTFNTWFSAVSSTLPGASAAVNTNTVVSCSNAVCPAGAAGIQQDTRTTVSVTISWQLPGGTAHTYSGNAVISAQKQL